MGMFSYMSECSGKQIVDGAQVRLYFLLKGVVVEEMRGYYDCYGSVNTMSTHLYRNSEGELVNVTDNMKKKISFSGDNWVTDEWSSMVNTHFGNDELSGFAAVLEEEVGNDYVPTCKSDNDPDQGASPEEYDEPDWFDEGDDDDDDDDDYWD